MYSMILPAGNAKVFVDQIFRIFDKDGNGSIDFKVANTWMFIESKLKFLSRSLWWQQTWLQVDHQKRSYVGPSKCMIRMVQVSEEQLDFELL